MLKYGATLLGINKFVAKIGYENINSQQLFNKFKFSEQSRSDVFQEITLERNVDSEWNRWLDEQQTYEAVNYSR